MSIATCSTFGWQPGRLPSVRAVLSSGLVASLNYHTGCLKEGTTFEFSREQIDKIWGRLEFIVTSVDFQLKCAHLVL